MKESDIKIAGVRLRIARMGGQENVPTIIFLHESFGCIDHWRDFPEKVGSATGCNVLIYDRQGYGKSDPFSVLSRSRDYLEKEADVLYGIVGRKLKGPLLFGHSDGGSIALIAAAKYPHIFCGVITEGAHVMVEEITLEGIRRAVDAYDNGGLKQKLERYHGQKTDAVFRMWADTWLSAGFVSWNIEHLLPQIQCPVLVIQGRGDEYGSYSQVASIAGRVGGCAEEFMPSGGHTPHREHSEEVIGRSVEFIKRVVSGQIR